MVEKKARNFSTYHRQRQQLTITATMKTTTSHDNGNQFTLQQKTNQTTPAKPKS
jgi:hypothetical protein